MNLSPVFTLAARSEDAYTAAQDWIRNHAPIAEQRLKRGSLKTFVQVCAVALAVIDWVEVQADKRHEYQLRVQLAYVRAKRFAVRQLIKAARFNERYQLTATAAKVWTRKGAIAIKAMDKVFSLEA